jgi:UDP-2,3-diacylglucosamine pyrophosphatase LpxH
MLLVISDLHLEDSRVIPEQLVSRQFQFLDSICRHTRSLGVAKITLVILGDFLECLKSKLWLGATRPWFRDLASNQIVVDLVRAIIDRNDVFFARLRQFCSDNDVKIRYVLGNHDAILRGVPAAQHLITTTLPRLRIHPGSTIIEREHAAVLLHGQEWDPDNRISEPGKAPFGDAFVVEVVAALPGLVAKHLKIPEPEFLLDIDRIRPQSPTVIARWLSEEAGRQPRKAMKNAINAAFRDSIVGLQSAFDSNLVSRGAHAKWIERVLALNPLVALSFPADTITETIDYRAMAQSGLRDPETRFVICGHTHLADSAPLKSRTNGYSNPMYFNTGSWTHASRYVGADLPGRAPYSRSFETGILILYSDGERRLGLPPYEFHRGQFGV